ncbi:polysaccharide deacetylase family protein [Streptomyces mayteni]
MLGMAGCGLSGDEPDGEEKKREKRNEVSPDHPGPPSREALERAGRLIGDGSTADVGAQPNQPEAKRIEPGEEPPQFVVFSWDGAGEDGNRLFSHFRQVAKESNAHMTYFLSGLYLLPEAERASYLPPGHSTGASDIGYLRDESIHATIEQLRGAWLDGSEVGTHFNGHFCGPGGVGDWSPADWVNETEQAKWMVKNWRTTTGFEDLEPLPFDYDKELVGGRTPCLEGQQNLLSAATDMGFRYDSSGSGRQVWPERTPEGIWDIPLQEVPVPGRAFETLSMDYNYMYNQSGPSSGDPSMHPVWEEQMRGGLLQAFDRAHQGNRAPLIIGNHFEDWNDGIYMRAVEDVIRDVCPREGVRCVSFRQLVDWLDAQDPEVLDRLRALDVGEAPPGGWAEFLGAAKQAAAPAGQGVLGVQGVPGVLAAPAVPGRPATQARAR